MTISQYINAKARTFGERRSVDAYTYLKGHEAEANSFDCFSSVRMERRETDNPLNIMDNIKTIMSSPDGRPLSVFEHSGAVSGFRGFNLEYTSRSVLHSSPNARYNTLTLNYCDELIAEVRRGYNPADGFVDRVTIGPDFPEVIRLSDAVALSRLSECIDSMHKIGTSSDNVVRAMISCYASDDNLHSIQNHLNPIIKKEKRQNMLRMACKKLNF